MKNILLFVSLLCLFHSTGCLTLSEMPIDERPSVRTHEEDFSKAMVGIWKLREDTNVHDYYVIEPHGENAYCVSHMNRGGDNRRTEHAMVYFSEINGVSFINVPYHDPFVEPVLKGYIFLRVLSHDHNGFELTALAVNDPMLKTISTPAEVRKRIAANMHKPSYYLKDTLHFRKKLPMGMCK